ncbi:MAG: hypothetical protein EOO88_00925 [Pedobacter sp.]|nr:MAG: hypothetical protein EOO88_00925 [Pedobacter sp.]
MGIQTNGMFGGFYKKTGPLIGKRAKGRNLVTALHHPSNKKSSEKQIRQQDKFTMLTQFFLPIGNLVSAGFKQYANRNTPLNAACKFNWDHAFLEVDSGTGLESETVLNYPHLVYSRGNIATPNCPTVSFMEILPGQLDIIFNWLPESQSRYNQSTDLASFVAYNTTTKTFHTAINAASRSSLSYTLRIFGAASADLIYCYINFSNSCSKLTGNSVCVNII